MYTAMIYHHIEKGIFLSRPNRFIAHIELDSRKGVTEICHVKNTGRCKELLIPGTEVFIQRSDNPSRKTKYDLIAVNKNGTLINMDSQAPNLAAAEWLANGNLFSANAVIRREVTFGNSRFDLYIEDGDRKAFMEVKGVTLEDHGIARFPDAPTKRGIKHIQELISCQKQGYESYLLFVIQMKGINHLEPNDTTHPAFGDALREAAELGVRILAYDCLVKPDLMLIDQKIPVSLKSVSL